LKKYTLLLFCSTFFLIFCSCKNEKKWDYNYPHISENNTSYYELYNFDIHILERNSDNILLPTDTIDTKNRATYLFFNPHLMYYNAGAKILGKNGALFRIKNINFYLKNTDGLKKNINNLLLEENNRIGLYSKSKYRKLYYNTKKNSPDDVLYFQNDSMIYDYYNKQKNDMYVSYQSFNSITQIVNYLNKGCVNNFSNILLKFENKNIFDKPSFSLLMVELEFENSKLLKQSKMCYYSPVR
jgi:hypothetical protein